MQARALIMLLVAVLLGGIAVFLVNNMLSEKVAQRAQVPGLDTRPVVVAAVDLDVGTRLDAAMLREVQWPAVTVPDGAYTSVNAVVGDAPPVALKEMRKGEPVLAYKLSPMGARGGLTVRIPPDMRAVTVAVNEVRGVAGFVLPGDHVDVLSTTAQGRSDNLPVTRLLAQNIQVLGVDQVSSEKENDPKVVNAVTLLVTVEQGQKIALAQRVGEVTLLLRNEADAVAARANEITLSSLSGESAIAPAAPAAQARPRAAAVSSRTSVRLIRGLAVNQVTVNKDAPPLPAQVSTSESGGGK